MKRAADLVLSGVVFFLLSPAVLLIAFMIRLLMGQPILFRQTRPGFEGAPFTIYKFRTMDSENGKPAPDAERITPMGALLRRTSLDELPELWNVLIGDMSLVGPRPLLMEYLDRYTPQQARRHEVKPGITGLAQVSGRNALSWEARLALDVWYVDNWSMWLDLKILTKTVGQVLIRGGISAPGHATMPKFRGES